ncbi:MAG: 30S ribosomal protein S2 [Deltaproteobacteria bacterium]|nr:30S ribosomal protein S2 [Deltaproteobacteria bacterium]
MENSFDSTKQDSTKSSAQYIRKTQDTVIEVQDRPAVEINIHTLLNAGAHFGHQTSRWNPKMAPFIHSAKNGIHIVNLPKTVQCWQLARQAIVDIAAQGGNILFVGTKKQAQASIVEEAKRCGAYYVSQRWLGGMLTNFQTIRKSVDRMKRLQQILSDDNDTQQGSSVASRHTKKERLLMARELEKLEFSLGGIKEMHRVPDLLFIVDVRREDIAIKEAKRIDIPVVAIVDTNCDPSDITHLIPANDDGSRSIRIFASAVADAIMEGRRLMKEKGLTVNDKPDVGSVTVNADTSVLEGRFANESKTEGVTDKNEAN